MNHRAHAVAGAGLFLVGAWGAHLAPESAALGTAVAVMAALAPDLDKRGSTAARFLGPVTGLAAWALEGTVGHRGALHSLLAAAAVAAVALHVGGFLVGAAVFLGWWSHLLTDALTPSGVPLFWPCPYRWRLAARSRSRARRYSETPHPVATRVTPKVSSHATAPITRSTVAMRALPAVSIAPRSTRPTQDSARRNRYEAITRPPRRGGPATRPRPRPR